MRYKHMHACLHATAHISMKILEFQSYKQNNLEIFSLNKKIK